MVTADFQLAVRQKTKVLARWHPLVQCRFHRLDIGFYMGKKGLVTCTEIIKIVRAFPHRYKLIYWATAVAQIKYFALQATGRQVLLFPRTKTGLHVTIDNIHIALLADITD